MDKNAALETRKPVGIMPMVVLCVFTAVVLFCGLLDDNARQAMLPDHPVVSDAKAQQSTPVVPKRPFTASEWRVGKATAPGDDGKSKLFLIASGPVLFVGSRQPARGAVAASRDARAPLHDYRARAPPEAVRRLHIGVAA